MTSKCESILFRSARKIQRETELARLWVASAGPCRAKRGNFEIFNIRSVVKYQKKLKEEPVDKTSFQKKGKLEF